MSKIPNQDFLFDGGCVRLDTGLRTEIVRNVGSRTPKCFLRRLLREIEAQLSDFPEAHAVKADVGKT
ncbi:hypothetical protein ACFKHW_40030 (plasmid) [Bradyrhizobium lupini]|uniref:hypothetical protein n=1 Tax=Rhizobium lupini TaxID=136996 RepID=UPI00367358BF